MKNSMLLLILGLLIWLPEGMAQQGSKTKNRFKAGLLLGVNLAQMDGDLHLGYKKIGIEGGLRGAAYLTERWDLNVELLFSQRGSKATEGLGFADPNAINVRKPINILLNYAESVFLLNYKFNENWDGQYTLQFFGGISYGRLLNSKVEETIYDINNANEVQYAKIKEDFSKNVLTGIIGLSWYITPQVGLTVRHALALTLLHKGDTQIPGSPDLRSMRLNFNLGYWF